MLPRQPALVFKARSLPVLCALPLGRGLNYFNRLYYCKFLSQVEIGNLQTLFSKYHPKNFLRLRALFSPKVLGVNGLGRPKLRIQNRGCEWNVSGR